MENLNPFQNLFIFNASNDINNNFVNTLRMLISFNSEQTSEQINKSIERKIYTTIPKISSQDEMLNKMKIAGYINILEKTNHSEYYLEIKQKSHIGDFLIFKLIENLRRLYSANRNGSRFYSKIHKNNNIQQLEEQQNLIYESFDLIKDKINFDNSINFFKGSFLGENKACHKADLFFFLGFHENLSKENHEKHINLYKIFFGNYNLDSKFLVDNLINLSYPNHLQSVIKKNISFLTEEFYEELINKFSKRDFVKIGSISLDLFIELANKNINANPDIKTFYFARLLHHKNYFIEKRFSKEEINSLKTYLADCQECSNLIIKHLNDLSNQNNQFINFCIEIIPNFIDEKILINILRENFPSSLSQKIISKYEFNEQFLFKVCSNITKLNDSNKLLKNLITFFEEKLTTNSLLNILALDVNLIEHLNPIIMNRKLGEELKINQKTKNLLKI